MTPSTPHHPPGHGRPLDNQEAARLREIAECHADDLGPLLTWPAPAPATTAGPRGRRVLRRSGWPAWFALLLGLALVSWGVRADEGWPLLAGVVLTVTPHHWLALPYLPVVSQAWRDRSSARP